MQNEPKNDRFNMMIFGSFLHIYYEFSLGLMYGKK